MRSMHFWPSLGYHLPTLLVLYFHIPWWGKSSVSFSRVFMIVICRLKACSGGTLVSSHFDRKVTWTLQRRSPPKRGIGHSGIFKKVCSKVRSPGWHSRDWKNKQFCTSPETPVTEMDWDVFCATLMLRLHLSESQSAHFLLSWGSCGETGTGLLKSHGGPGPLHPSSVLLSFYHMRGSHFCFIAFPSYVLAQGNLFSNAFPPYRKCTVPSTMAIYLPLGFC